MKLQQILAGTDQASQERLDEFFAGIGREKILWYPSAGFDYRDVLKFSPAQCKIHKIQEQPNIFCHTDYCYEWTKLEEPVIYQDDRTKIEVIKKHPLKIADGVPFSYAVNPECVDFPGKAMEAPTIYLLDLKISSNILGESKAVVFFFLFENYNFLQEVVLRNRLRISFLLKSCEGCGFGGNRKSITVCYSMLANIGVKYLLIDDEIHYCRKTHDEIARKFNLNHKDFDLQQLSSTQWGMWKVNGFRVIPQPGLLTAGKMDSILNQIAGSRGVDYY